MKARFSLIALLALCWSFSASATLLSYDFTVSSNNFLGNGAFGLSGTTNNLSGSFVVDNTLVGAEALIEFSYTTGIQTWNVSDLDPTVLLVDLEFDALGELLDGWIFSFRDTLGTLVLASRDTQNLQDGSGIYSCNNCVDFTKSVAVPVPPTFLLFALGLAFLVLGSRCGIGNSVSRAGAGPPSNS